MNVALYGPHARAWSLTERAHPVLAPDAALLGPSAMTLERGEVVVRVREATAPWGRPLRGRVRFVPEARGGDWVALDAAGAHRWCPFSPVGRIEVAMEEPRLTFRGAGYFDGNAGDGPLEDAFAGWSWWRAGSRIGYRAEARDGRVFDRSCIVDGGSVRPAEDAWCALPATRWGLSRTMSGEAPAVVRSLEDGPFYARSVVRARVAGRDVDAMHETVSLDRFRAPWVRALLPFRMRRA